MEISRDNNDIVKKEDSKMDTNTLEYRRLDFSKISKRITGTMSTEESLKDVIPIDWSDEVLSGNKKVMIDNL